MEKVICDTSPGTTRDPSKTTYSKTAFRNTTVKKIIFMSLTYCPGTFEFISEDQPRESSNTPRVPSGLERIYWARGFPWVIPSEANEANEANEGNEASEKKGN